MDALKHPYFVEEIVIGSEDPKFTLTRRTFLFSALAVTAGLSRGILPGGLTAQAQSTPSFSFAYITDTHLATGLPDNVKLLAESQLFLQNAVKTIREQEVDFVLLGGDQVEGPGRDDIHWQLYVDIIQTLEKPWYFVLGEQDISGPQPVDKQRTYGPDFKGKGITTGESYWSLDPVNGVHLIGLDTAKANSNTGELRSAQLDWLKSDLKANHGKFTIVAGHHPLLPPAPYDSGPPWDEYIVSQGAQAREILGSSRDVKLVLNGHIGISKVQKERDIWYVSAAGLVIYPCQFKIFRVNGNGITIETYQVSYPALVKKAKTALSTARVCFQYDSKKPQLYMQLTEGDALDNNCLLPLTPGAVPVKTGKKDKKKKPAKKPAKVKAKKEDKKSKVKSEPGPVQAPQPAPQQDVKGAPEVVPSGAVTAPVPTTVIPDSQTK
ncbi:MAG: metallophosphoesterase [Candidatus Obscuribacter sp.]|nr:metallophosphoesterase [Candidatus Obscuribacter sp.]